jgi:lipoyl(octanoyl) transferase
MESTPIVYFRDVGLIDYKECWDLQEKLHAECITKKMLRRDNESADLPNNYLLFCEHPHVYTLGKSGSLDNLLIDEKGLEKLNATYYKINRGGDITYHGPGQMVVYPIFDLEQFFTDIHKYLRFLEEAVIRTLAHFGIVADRFPGYTGVWIEPDNQIKARKICAMGVRASRWVTMHGLAFNINTDLHYFEHIIPCGIKDKDVSSIQKELGEKLNMNEVKKILLQEITQVFQFQLMYEKENI